MTYEEATQIQPTALKPSFSAGPILEEDAEDTNESQEEETEKTSS